jgi:MFS family permease
MMNGLQTLSYWQEYFNHPRGSILGLFNASMSLGSLIGLFVVPYLIDWAGRRAGVALGCVVMLLAVGLQTGAQNFGMFVAARILLGFGDCIVLGSAPLLIAEIAHPQDRAILVTLSGASYHSGAFISSWVTYGTLQIKVCPQRKYRNCAYANSEIRATGLGDSLVFFSPSVVSSSWSPSIGCQRAPVGS